MATTLTVQQVLLLNLIEDRDFATLINLIDEKVPELPRHEQRAYTSGAGVKQLLIAAARADAPPIFAMLWDRCSKYTTDLEIPYECLDHAARTGSIGLASAFAEREPNVLTRAPPNGDLDAGQMMTAFCAGQRQYVDYLRAMGISLDHDWPRFRFLTVVVGLEQTDEQLLANVEWALVRRARVRGTGALRKVASRGAVEVAKLLLDAGANVDDLRDDSFDDPESAPPVQTALMEAAKKGHMPMVKLLAKGGAELDWKNEEGESPRSVLVAAGHRALVEECEKEFKTRCYAMAVNGWANGR